MANRDDAEEEETLSEGQRLSILEKGVLLNKVLVISLLAVVLIALTVSITLLAVADFDSPPEALLTRIDQLQTQLQTTETALQALREEVQQLDAAPSDNKAGSADIAAMKAVLQEQEQSYQAFLAALKNGMRDIARMVPGSRTWLEVYSEQMDEAITLSQARAERLAATPAETPATSAKPPPSTPPKKVQTAPPEDEEDAVITF